MNIVEDYIKNLFKFSDILEYYLYPQHSVDLIKDTVSLIQANEKLDPQKSYVENKLFKDYITKIKSDIVKIDDSINKPVTKESFLLDIFHHGGGDPLNKNKTAINGYDYDADVGNIKHYLYHVNWKYDIAIDGLKDGEAINLTPSIDVLIRRYIDVRNSIKICNYELSRMILCFDLIIDNLLEYFEIESNFKIIMHKPILVYHTHLIADWFKPHVLSVEELKKNLADLISLNRHESDIDQMTQTDLDFSNTPLTEDFILRTDREELRCYLNNNFIHQIKMNIEDLSDENKRYFLDDINDLIDLLKKYIEPRSAKRYLDNFSARIDSLRKPNTFEVLQDKEINRHKDLKNTYWFYVGTKFLSGEIEKLYNQQKNFTDIAKELSNENLKTKSLRPYISESYNNTTKSDKNIFYKKDLTKIVEYLKDNNIKISPKYQHLDTN